MSEFLEIRCGRNRFLVSSSEIDSIEVIESDLQPFIETVLECFGPGRVMFGSDWPVALVACTYKHWIDVVERATASLSLSERNRLFGGTAKEAYQL